MLFEMKELSAEEFEERVAFWSERLNSNRVKCTPGHMRYYIAASQQSELVLVQNVAGFSQCFLEKADFSPLSRILPTGKELIRRLLDGDSEERRILETLADALDQLGSYNRHVFWLDPDLILWDGSRILFHPFAWPQMFVSDETVVNPKIRNQYGYKMAVKNPRIAAGQIDSDLERVAFLYFLLELLFPEVPFRKMDRTMIPKFLKYFSRAGVFMKKFLSRWFGKSQNEKIAEKPREMLQGIIGAAKNNPLAPLPYQEARYECEYDVRRGRHKKGTHSEDEYEVIESGKHEKSRYFIFVSDGVSTADFGDGDGMVRFLRDQVQNQKEQIASFLDSLSTDDARKFAEESRSFLLDLCRKLNEAAIEKLNEQLKKEGKSAEGIQHPMSATLVLGVVCGNWVHFVHMGDSEVIFVRGADAYILNTPHNGLRDRLLEEAAHAQEIRSRVDGDEELTLVIPEFSIEQGRFVSSLDANALESVSLYLQKGDLLLFCTDGLLSCLGHNPAQREDALPELLRILRETDALPFYDRIQKLLDEAKKTGEDDVAVVGLKNMGLPVATLASGQEKEREKQGSREKESSISITIRDSKKERKL